MDPPPGRHGLGPVRRFRAGSLRYRWRQSAPVVGATWRACVETLLVAVVAVIVGLLVAGWGTRFFYLLLPLWGFLTGLALGADLVATAAGSGVFGSLASWLVGAALGIVLAAVAGLWFRGAVLVLGVGLGVSVASGLVASVGIDGGPVTLFAGVALGVAVGVALALGEAPLRLVAAITSYGGAIWLTTGLLLLAGRVHVADLHAVGAAGALRGDVPAIAIAFVLGTVAFGYQNLDLRARRIEAVRRDGYRF